MLPNQRTVYFDESLIVTHKTIFNISLALVFLQFANLKLTILDISDVDTVWT